MHIEIQCFTGMCKASVYYKCMYTYPAHAVGPLQVFVFAHASRTHLPSLPRTQPHVSAFRRFMHFYGTPWVVTLLLMLANSAIYREAYTCIGNFFEIYSN